MPIFWAIYSGEVDQGMTIGHAAKQEWVLALDLDRVFVAVVAKFALTQARVKFNLIHHWPYFCRLSQSLKPVNIKVRHD
jgi:hypothetical protein